jgi:zinc transport system ATP-binding protein
MLTIKALSFNYPNKEPIFEKINLSITPKTLSVIIGPNGGGKTTLLNLLMGFLSPSTGEITNTFEQIGYVPQSTKIDLEYPIRLIDHVLIGAIQQRTWWGGFNKKTYQFVEEILHKLDLLHLKDAMLKTLSGGQLQRAQIAHALACSPDLLILDEPTSNIDPKARKYIIELLHKLKQEITVIMVTHDLETLLEDTDQIFLVSNNVKQLDKSSLCRHTFMGLYETQLGRKKALE